MTQVNPSKKPNPCPKCGSTSFWADGRCGPCATRRKKHYKDTHVTGQPKRRAPNGSKPPHIPTRKQSKKMSKGKDKQCHACGNTSEWWKDGSCQPCRRKASKEAYRRDSADAHKLEKRREWQRAYAKKRKEWELQPYHKTEAAKRGQRKRKKYIAEATPDWLTKEQWADIHTLYFKARWLTNNTDKKYVVDHIIPISGKNVRGLHVPWNLQVITYDENAAKFNK